MVLVHWHAPLVKELEFNLATSTVGMNEFYVSDFSFFPLLFAIKQVYLLCIYSLTNLPLTDRFAKTRLMIMWAWDTEIGFLQTICGDGNTSPNSGSLGIAPFRPYIWDSYSRKDGDGEKTSPMIVRDKDGDYTFYLFIVRENEGLGGTPGLPSLTIWIYGKPGITVSWLSGSAYLAVNSLIEIWKCWYWLLDLDVCNSIVPLFWYFHVDQGIQGRWLSSAKNTRQWSFWICYEANVLSFNVYALHEIVELRSCICLVCLFIYE